RRGELAPIAQVHERPEPLVGHEDDAAALAPVPARRPSEGAVLLAAERHAAVPAVPRDHLDLDLVDEAHEPTGLTSIQSPAPCERPDGAVSMSSAPSEQGDVASRPPESGDFGAIRVSIRAAMAERRQTALGVARARFVEGLPRKARELRASLALLAGTPDEERPREELRRRLHALYASSQVFRIEPLALALKDALAEIDEVRDARRGFTQDELDRLANLAATLPALGRDDEEPPGTPSVPVGPPEPAPAPVSAPHAPPPRAPKPRAKAHGGVSTVVGVLVV